MSINYEEINSYNKYQLGADLAARMDQVAMYADSAHFIYEILQNADDANATEIEFTISDEQLVIEHNGTPFSINDVKAISYFGAGKEDKTKIGHFGLGFKSVFAYTATPKIHSGDLHFEITGLYSIRAVLPPDGLRSDRTRFIFPFDHETAFDGKPRQERYIREERLISPEVAKKQIANKLRGLGPETLLFTRNLSKIKWNADGQTGHLHRKAEVLPDGSHEGVRKICINAAGQERRFLIFEQLVSEGLPTGRLVQIAYQLSKKEPLGELKITLVRNAKLFVFFQTDKETHTGLILQAPYRTTPARDNVFDDDEFNIQLVKQSAKLLVESLEKLKNLKLLTLEALSTLPLDSDYFTEEPFFLPLYEAVREALQTRPLLPTSTCGFISAQQAKIARTSNLAKVFSAPEQLDILFGKGIRWLDTNLTPANYRELHDLLVGERDGNSRWDAWKHEPLAEDMVVDADDLAKKLTLNFMEQQHDQWLINFMLELNKSDALTNSLRNTPIIRLENGQHVKPKDNNNKPNAYLPPQNGVNEFQDFPIVKAYLIEDPAVLEFLRSKLGLSTPDLVDYTITKILPRYHGGPNKLDLPSWKKDFKNIVSALAQASGDKKGQLLYKFRNILHFLQETGSAI
ncbi:MAG: hypothetical protein ORN54_03175 [Cyclobacteriaceae bacterium]|nr:hypothetical protein [Cyclobacteriaceae bacterium]